MNKPRWVFFDIGYTLINEDEAHRKRIEILAPILSVRGISSEEFYNAMLDASRRYSSSPFNTATEQFGISEKVPYPKKYESPYKEAVGLLEWLNGEYSLGIIANQSAGGRDRLESHGLSKYFKVFVLSAEDGVSKPDLAIYRLALERSGCSPNEAVMIGDRLDNDVYPAKLLGMYTIRIKQGLASVQDPVSEDYSPDFSVSDLNGLHKIL
ncbi:MAG: HAD family hydrolase [Eubacteriales bacterium]